MLYPDQAFIDAYAGVEIRLPNRPPIRCRPLTIGAVAGLLSLIRQHAGGDEGALYELLRVLPRYMHATRKSRRIIAKLRGMEALRVVERLLGSTQDAKPDEPTRKTAQAVAAVNMLDHLHDFEHAYGYMPEPDMPWVLFMAGVERAHRYDVRQLLHVMTGTQWAIGAAFSKDSGAAQLKHRQLTDMAYPKARTNGNSQTLGEIILVDDPDQIDEVMKSRTPESDDG